MWPNNTVGREMNRLLLILASIGLGGCAAPDAFEVFGIPASYEPYGVPPRLTEAERLEIESAAALRSDFKLTRISELTSGGMEATLVRLNSPARALLLHFEKIDGHWVEDKAREKTVRLVVQ